MQPTTPGVQGIASGQGQYGSAIGTPIRPPATNDTVTAPTKIPGAVPAGTAPETPPMDAGGGQPPAIPGNNIGTPINAPAPRPAGDKLESLAAQGPPQYHGIKRLLDTLGGATNIGQAIEKGSGMGTVGYENQLKNAESAANAEESQVAAGEKERQANATAEETGASAKQKEAAATQTIITDPNTGHTISVPTSQAATLYRQIIGTEAAGKRNDANIQGRANLETQKETAAKALQEGKPITMDELAAQATQEGDQATLQKVEDFKKQIAAAGKQSPGSFVAVNDGAGGTVGWANPKTKEFVPASDIGGGAAVQAAGGGTAIPPKPSAAVQAGITGAKSALDYAKTYLASGKFTGPADEALMESFFELVKPSSGFRMSQPQINMLLGARSWMESAQGIAYHAKTGVWFPPEQRQQIVDAMTMRAQSKENALNSGDNKPTRNVGDSVTIKGKTMKITAVHPDGSFDAN